MNTDMNTSESSLTTPSDRNLNKKWKPDMSTPPLAEDQVAPAMEELNITSFIEKFPRVDRTYADPPIHLQTFGLVSFIPAKGASPNNDGIYGFAKLRGNYASTIEADQRAEYLIRNVDSYHQIFHAYVGRPFPLTKSSDYSQETKEVDIRRGMTESISESIKKVKEDETQTIQEMKNREEELLAESKKAKDDDQTKEPEVDPYEEYTTLCVKKAQLTWTLIEHINKLHQVRDSIINSRERLSELDVDHPDYKDKYYEKYMTARRAAGLPDDDHSFIKYMVEDIPAPTIDTDEVLPKKIKQ